MHRAGTTLVDLLGILAMTACATFPSLPTHVSLRVMSYNIEAGGGNLDRTTDPGASASVPLREYGVALLSRYPIVAWANHTITRLSTQTEGARPAPMPGFLEATIDVRGTRIRVFNTHLDYRPDPEVRRQQVAETLTIIGDPSVPMLLFGDLNAPPAAPELQPLFKRLRDSWTLSADSGFTYPATVPVRRIDYVLTSRHFRVRTMSVHESQASDHRPVIVELVVDQARK